MRYIALDPGTRRTGVAVGDNETSVVSPLHTIEIAPGPNLVSAVVDVVMAHAADAVVIGLPYNMDGTEGPQAKIVRAFGSELAAALDKPIHYQDERLTSYAADQQMSQSGRTHRQKKRLRDGLAAAEILNDFLDAQA